METVIGIKFNDFVLIATDMTAAHSIMVMKDGEETFAKRNKTLFVLKIVLNKIVNVIFIYTDEDKTYNITDNVVMGVTGEAGDVPRFAEYITQNVKLYRMRNGYDLSIPAIATFTRKTVAEHLRSQVINFYIFYLLAIHITLNRNV